LLLCDEVDGSKKSDGWVWFLILYFLISCDVKLRNENDYRIVLRINLPADSRGNGTLVDVDNTTS
jgi:hypothetical protein